MSEINSILLNENAYFYNKANSSSRRLTNSEISLIFQNAINDKNGNRLLEKVNETHIIEENSVSYSILVINFQHKPTFLEEEIESWNETKLAYLLIIEFHDFIVIAKKNVSGIQSFINTLIPLDYNLISTTFVNESTEFEKFTMKNLNISGSSIRNKSLEALDLKKTFYSLGANTYMLSGLRVKNGDEKISISPSTSKINHYGNRNNIIGFIEWADKILNEVRTHSDQETYLSIFSEPIDYESEKENLHPIAILILFSKLYEDFENGKIINAIYENEEGVSRDIDIFRFINNFEKFNSIEEEVVNNRIRYKVVSQVNNGIELRKLNKSIKIYSKKISRIKLIKDNGSNIHLIQYLNNNSSFIVNFQDVNLIYSNKKLFRDNKLLGNIDLFLEIFLAHDNLSNVSTEKGAFSFSQTEFDDNSIFNFVENEFRDESEFLICDDLGQEWADHISLSENSISFIHSKFKSSSFSASAFQDIIGQALKNLGNMTPADYQLQSKRGLWGSPYRNSSIETQLNRLRKGDNIDNAIDYYKKLRGNPNLNRKVYLVINFISKSELLNRIEKLKRQESFREKNQVIQIIWFISSLVASCKEIGVDIFIYCKP